MRPNMTAQLSFRSSRNVKYRRLGNVGRAHLRVGVVHDWLRPVSPSRPRPVYRLPRWLGPDRDYCCCPRDGGAPDRRQLLRRHGNRLAAERHRPHARRPHGGLLGAGLRQRPDHREAQPEGWPAVAATSGRLRDVHRVRGDATSAEESQSRPTSVPQSGQTLSKPSPSSAGTIRRLSLPHSGQSCGTRTSSLPGGAPSPSTRRSPSPLLPPDWY